MRTWLIAALALIGSAAVARTTFSPWWDAYERGGRLVSLPDGRKLNLYCEGQGSPTVVLEAGLGASASSWRFVQDEIARTTRVCAYDRAGLGHSPPGPMPRDTRAIVADLEQLLRASREHGPYVLVGHSMGAYSVRVFASRHRRDVAGLVLVDPSSEDQLTRLDAVAPGVAAKARTDSRASCAAAARPADQPGCILWPADLPPDLKDRFLATQSQVAFATLVAENDAFVDLDSAQLVRERRPLGDLPLIILTAGQSAEGATGKVWMQMHDETAALSARGENRLVPGAAHAIQRDKPAPVIAAVEDVVAAARKRKR